MVFDMAMCLSFLTSSLFFTFLFQGNNWLTRVPWLKIVIIGTKVPLARGGWAKNMKIPPTSSSLFQFGYFISSQSMALFLASSDAICFHCLRLQNDDVPKPLFYDLKSKHPTYLDFGVLPTWNNETFIELGISALGFLGDIIVHLQSNSWLL